jgi:hypothetical protein
LHGHRRRECRQPHPGRGRGINEDADKRPCWSLRTCRERPLATFPVRGGEAIRAGRKSYKGFTKLYVNLSLPDLFSADWRGALRTPRWRTRGGLSCVGSPSPSSDRKNRADAARCESQTQNVAAPTEAPFVELLEAPLFPELDGAALRTAITRSCKATGTPHFRTGCGVGAARSTTSAPARSRTWPSCSATKSGSPRTRPSSRPSRSGMRHEGAVVIAASTGCGEL